MAANLLSVSEVNDIVVVVDSRRGRCILGGSIGPIGSWASEGPIREAILD